VIGKTKPKFTAINSKIVREIHIGADIGKHILGIPISFKDYQTE
jgi:hypothetical protein